MDPVLSTLAIVSILALALTVHIGAGVGLAVLAAIFVWRLVPETKGKTLEDMTKLWKK